MKDDLAYIEHILYVNIKNTGIHKKYDSFRV